MTGSRHDPVRASSIEDLAAGIDWLGHSSFRVRGSRTVYIDPWQIGPGPHAPADLVLITHPHADHCSPSDLARLPGIENAEIVTVADASRKLARSCKVIEPGDRITVRGLTIAAVPAYNLDKPHHSKSNRWVGFLVEMDGRTIYHAGDTDRIPEMRAIACDVALLPVSGVYVMNAEEAAFAAGDLAARLAIPMHHGSLVGDPSDAKRFADRCPIPTMLLERASRSSSNG
jgi:L-ascorbate metabolism protein UlaG (beta-lactamase superfamily)